MKKFALCCLVLALAVMVVPQSQAATYCITLTSFCDQIQLTSQSVGGVQKTILYGAWDWECTGDLTDASIAGDPPGATTYLGTRPIYVGTDYAFAYTAEWSLKKSGFLFDLYGVTASSAIPFQLGQGWVLNNGACRAHRSNLPHATK